MIQSVDGWLAVGALVGVAVVAAVFQRRFARLRRRQRELSARMDAAEAAGDRVMRAAYSTAARAELAAHGSRPLQPIELVSQFGEEAFVWELLGRPLSGFFVEVGAYDGYWLSPTYFLESLGWRGVLVEPIPHRAEQCAARRPNARVVRSAVAGPGATGTAKFEIAEGGSGGGVADMASSLEMQHGQRAFVDRLGARTRTVEVPLTSLAAILDEARRDGAWDGRLDLAVIDVEGSEATVLAGLELERTRPRVVLVEDLTLGGDKAAWAVLEASGYKHVCWFGHNRLVVRSDEPGLAERAKLLADGPRGRGETTSPS